MCAIRSVGTSICRCPSGLGPPIQCERAVMMTDERSVLPDGWRDEQDDGCGEGGAKHWKESWQTRVETLSIALGSSSLRCQAEFNIKARASVATDRASSTIDSRHLPFTPQSTSSLPSLSTLHPVLTYSCSRVRTHVPPLTSPHSPCCAFPHHLSNFFPIPRAPVPIRPHPVHKYLSGSSAMCFGANLHSFQPRLFAENLPLPT